MIPLFAVDPLETSQGPLGVPDPTLKTTAITIWLLIPKHVLCLANSQPILERKLFALKGLQYVFLVIALYL